MTTSTERLKILKLVQDGKITPEEGIELLEALERHPRRRVAGKEGDSASSGAGGKEARWLCIRITDTTSGKLRVNVRLPTSVVTAGLSIGAKFSPEVEGLDQQALIKLIRSGTTGKVIDLYDEKDGEHVEVFLE